MTSTSQPQPEKREETRCRKCSRADLVPSMPRGLWDSIMKQFGRIPIHCRACGNRFYVPDPEQQEKQGREAKGAD